MTRTSPFSSVCAEIAGPVDHETVNALENAENDVGHVVTQNRSTEYQASSVECMPVGLFSAQK